MSRHEIRRDRERGVLRNAWLDARFSFSFGAHHDPRRPRFGPLLALNEDRVQPDSGFPMHPHRDLEIIMLPRSGRIEHRDSEGRHGFVHRGELQWMRAGRGIRHRQWNASDRELDHHFQLWFAPTTRGLDPRVETLAYRRPDAGQWRRLLSPNAPAGVLDIGVDVALWLGRADPDRPILLPARPPGGLYLHVMAGRVALHGDGLAPTTLDAGDALVCFDGVPALELAALLPAELLRLDTAAVDPATGLSLPPG